MRKLIAIAMCGMAVTGVLGVAGAAYAGPVEPAAQWNPISGTVHSDGSWTLYPTQRHKTDPGDMYLDLQDNVDGGLCVELVSSGRVFAGPVCWNAGEYGVKTVATNVKAPTTFSVQAKKGASGGSNNAWGGSFFY
jgi:hypothetical protein